MRRAFHLACEYSVQSIPESAYCTSSDAQPASPCHGLIFGATSASMALNSAISRVEPVRVAAVAVIDRPVEQVEFALLLDHLGSMRLDRRPLQAGEHERADLRAPDRPA